MKTSGPEELQIPKQGGYIQVFAETKKSFAELESAADSQKSNEMFTKKGCPNVENSCEQLSIVIFID